MADHAERVESALYQLVETFLPGHEDEDDSDTEARQDEHVQRAQDIIARFVSFVSEAAKQTSLNLLPQNIDSQCNRNWWKILNIWAT